MEMNPPQVEEGLENLQNEEITESEKNADDFKTVIGKKFPKVQRDEEKLNLPTGRTEGWRTSQSDDEQTEWKFKVVEVREVCHGF
jgi:hypothetical protein